MSEERATLSIAEVFSFYVRDDGKAVVSLTIGEETTPLVMDYDVMEKIGLNFMNVAAKARDVSEGRRKIQTYNGVRPAEPLPWGPRRLGKRDKKPN